MIELLNIDKRAVVKEFVLVFYSIDITPRKYHAWQRDVACYSPTLVLCAERRARRRNPQPGRQICIFRFDGTGEKGMIKVPLYPPKKTPTTQKRHADVNAVAVT